jgi:predicted transcriptional regulator
MSGTRSPVKQRETAREARRRIAAINATLVRINLSQRLLATQADMSQPHVCNVLNGRYPTPTFWTLLRLERAVAYFQNKVAR